MVSLGSPKVGPEEQAFVSEVLEEGALSTGELVQEFEKEFSSFAGRTDGVAVCSASVALELTLEELFDPGSVILVSPFNCGAILYSLLRTGLQPLFVDIDPRTYGIDPANVVSTLADVSTDADGMLVTHLYGQPSSMSELCEIARERDLVLVEDFAQAPGARYRESTAGSFGHASVCSFGATKNLTTAEGGIVVSDDDEFVATVRSRRSNTDPGARVAPRSVRMNDLEAAIGLAQLEKYEEIIESKRTSARRYRDKLAHLPVALPTALNDRTHVYHGFPIRTEAADELVEHLRAHDVGCARVYDVPLNEYALAPETTSTYPHSSAVADEVVLLPIHANLDADDVDTVTTALRSFFSGES